MWSGQFQSTASDKMIQGNVVAQLPPNFPHNRNPIVVSATCTGWFRNQVTKDFSVEWKLLNTVDFGKPIYVGRVGEHLVVKFSIENQTCNGVYTSKDPYDQGLFVLHSKPPESSTTCTIV